MAAFRQEVADKIKAEKAKKAAEYRKELLEACRNHWVLKHGTKVTPPWATYQKPSAASIRKMSKS